MKIHSAGFKTIAAIASLWCFFTPVFSQQLPHGYVNVGGTRVYVEGGGSGDALFLVHAGFQDKRMWKHQVPAFIKNYQVILIDLPGHGLTIDSDRLPLAETVIRTVMDSLHIQQATLMGVSLGAAVITDFAIAYPQRVRSLVLVSSGLTGWEEGRQLQPETSRYIAMFDSSLTRKDTASAAEVFTHFWFDGPARKPGSFDTELRKLILNSTYYNLKQHKVSGWPKFASPSAIHRLSKIKVPVLLITGSADMPEVMLMNTFIAGNITGSKKVMIEGAGHLLNVERPQQFNNEVINFLPKR